MRLFFAWKHLIVLARGCRYRQCFTNTARGENESFSFAFPFGFLFFLDKLVKSATLNNREQ